MSRTLAAMFVACTVVGTVTVQAQVKTIPGAFRTETATVETVDVEGRRVTLRMATGHLRTVAVPEATRLSQIKAGDRVHATYYDNIVVRRKERGEADVDTLQAATTAGRGAQPGATVATQQTMTATVERIDLEAPSIALKGPRQWRYETKVQDRKALAQLSVGERVDVTWTDATLVSVAPAGK
jgi:Cu/Ag efflux protein CusF